MELSPAEFTARSGSIIRKTSSYKVSADAIIFNEAGLQVAVVENGVAQLR
ncbi:MAG TPA: hypothetical protein VGH62_15210 [Bradyrhizobium sp.]|jgi:hypothetical protein